MLEYGVMDEKPLTVEQVAAHLSVSRDTVRRWLRDGVLRGRSLGRRAGYRITPEEVQRFLREGGERDRA